MKRSHSFLLFLIIVLIAPIAAHAQLWSGVISPNRAIDWTQAGLPGYALPDSAWTQCGSTIAAYSGTANAINNALSACGTNQYVSLGAGTFTLSTCIQFPTNTVGHLVLRGQGSTSTQLNFTALSCQGFIVATSSDSSFAEQGGSPHWVQVTSGYSKGSTRLILSSKSTVVVGSILVLNQCDTGFTGGGLSAACNGTANDNGGYFHCQAPWSATNVGCAVATEGGVNSWRNGSSEMEGVAVTAINAGGCGATCVTLSKPIEQPDWGSDTQAVIIQPLPQVGVENLALDGAALANGVGIYFFNTYHSWVSGVRISNVAARSVHLFGDWGDLVKDSYFFGNPTGYGDNTGIRAVGGANNLIQNNICHQTHLCYLGADAQPEQGDVFAYNFSTNQTNGSTANAIGSAQLHGAGANFQLYEGNAMFSTQEDGDHGAELSQTKFRNFIWGWTSCANGQCGAGNTASTGIDQSAIRIFYGSRYGNIVGNVLGTSGRSLNYKTFGTFDNGSIYILGAGQNVGGFNEPADPLVSTTTLLWGNYDTVTSAVRWCGNSSDTGWSTTCSSTAEVATGAPTYPNSVPTLGDTGAGQGALPNSFYLASRPAWFGSLPWPGIGPDVSSGNIGQCAGTPDTAGKYNGVAATNSSQCAGSALNTAWGSHVNANPAMACYFSLGGLPDGTGNILAFDPRTCYGLATPSTLSSAPQAPTDLVVVVN
jgi:hypothetical protein